MKDENPVADLECLERLLAAGPQPEPAPALRQRVLHNVRTELHRSAPVSYRSMTVELRRNDLLPRWRLAAAAAAIVLVWASLSLTAAQVAFAAFQPRAPRPAVADIAKQIQELSPDFLPDESLREARLLQLAGEVASRPIFGVDQTIRGVGRRDDAKPNESPGQSDSQRASPPPDARGTNHPAADPQGARLLTPIENY
jgi:hypothetical protein